MWLLNEIPNDILEMLNLGKKDMGIDIIVENDGNFYAVQCKYKNNKSRCLSWKTLSTFYALCSKSGPWEKHIVMTSCIKTNYQGIITEKDVSYCLGTFKNIKKENWLKMCKITKGYTLNESILPNIELKENKNISENKKDILENKKDILENKKDILENKKDISEERKEIDFNTLTDLSNLSEKDRIRYIRLLKFT